MKKLILLALTAMLAMPCVANADTVTADVANGNIIDAATWNPDGVPSAGNDYVQGAVRVRGFGTTATADEFLGDSFTVGSGQFWSGAANAHVQFAGDLNLASDGIVRAANNGSFRLNVLGDINVSDGATINGGSTTAQDILFTGGAVKGTGTFNIDSVTGGRDGGVTFQAGVDWTEFTGTLAVTTRGDLNFAFGGAVAIPEAEGNFSLFIDDSQPGVGYQNTKDIFVAGLTVGTTVYAPGMYNSATLSAASTAIADGGGTITVKAVTVPEPGSLALLGLGAIGMCVRRKR